MEFNVLGPVRVTHEGAPVALGGPQQQTILCVLLVHAGTVVSADRLIDEAWGEAPPASARRTLQSSVARLRKALNVDAEILGGRVPGYVLEVEPSVVDSLVFVTTVENAATLASQDPATASEMLSNALGMWHGRPFDGLAENAPSLYAEAVRLGELRVTAVEQRIECDLGTGKHRELIPELEYLTNEFPLRERFWHQLMTAFYRSGRQSDALRSYQKARHILAVELGIEPAKELQQLEEGILLHEAQLATDADAQPAPPTSEPPQPGRTVRGYELRELVRDRPNVTVFRAYEPTMGREVAVTVIDPEIASEPDFIRTFDETVRRIARLEHPHIVPVYDFWRDPGGAFIVSRWVPGLSLRAALERGPWRWDATMAMIQQLGDALTSAHRKGIAHGHLTAADVVIDDESNSHLTGFELSLVSNGQAASDFGPAARRADTKALGVLLVEVLTGTTCEADRPNSDAWVEAQLLQLPRAIPPAVDELIRRAACDVDDAFQTPDELLIAIAATEPGRNATFARADVAIENPYKGLRPFQEADAQDFFGREALVDQLVAALVGPTSTRFVAVVGPSGCGKSSVVRAGLIPAVRTDAVQGTAGWFVATMVPGKYPFEELEAALLRIAGDPQPGLGNLLTSDATGLRRALKQLMPPGEGELVLVVDQLEELFTMTDQATRSLLIDSVVNAVTDPRSRLRVVATLRADFFDRPLHHPELGRMVDEGLVNVIPLNPTELQQAITRPANRIGVDVDSDLVGRMIADVAERPGALPLLQYVLTELFDARDARRMTLDAYEAIGGINGALGGRAEEVFVSLTQPAREAARQLFLRLVTIDEAAQETRNRVSRRSLSTIADGAAMSRAIDAFAGARLVAFDADPVSGLPTVQVAHEAMFRAWPRLEEWIDATRSARHAQRRLGTAVTDWIEHDRDADYLASGRRLAEFESLDADGQLALIPLEREYVAASRHRDDAARRTRSRRRRAVTVTLLAAFVIAGTLAIIAVMQRRNAEAEARIALARELAAASVAALDLDPELSILLALEAADVTSAADGVVLVRAEEALRLAVFENRLLRTIPNARVGAFDPDGTHYAAGDGAGDVRLWDLSTGAVEQLPEPHRGQVTTLAFSLDGHLVISGGFDNAVKVWDTSTGTVRTLRRHLRPVSDVAISPDGQRLATTSDDGTARVWDLAGDADQELLIEPNATAAVAFDPMRPRLAVIDPVNPEARLVDAESGDTVGRLPHRFPVTGLEFLPDGSLLATAMEDGTVTIWDSQALTVVRSYGAGGLNLAVNRQGDLLATAGDDGVVRVWNTASGTETLRLAGHRGQVTSLSFDAAGTRLASAGVDGTARIWDISHDGNREAVSLVGIADPARVEFSSDSRFLAAAGNDDANAPEAMIWDTGTWTLLHDFPGTVAVAMSPDGSRFATIDERRLVTVRDMSGDVLIEPMQERIPAAPDLVTAVAFAPNGALMITGDAVGSVQVWEADLSRLVATMPGSHAGAVVGFETDATGRYLLSYGESALVWDIANAREVSAPMPPGGLTAAALSSDGTVVLTGGRDGATRAWNAMTAEALDTPFLVGAGTVRGIAYSPDGQRIATASDDGTIRLWDANTGELLIRWPAHGAGATDVSFSGDGRFLVSSGNDGTIRVYLAQTDDLVDLARSRVTRTLTDDECRRFLHVEACPSDT